MLCSLSSPIVHAARFLYSVALSVYLLLISQSKVQHKHVHLLNELHPATSVFVYILSFLYYVTKEILCSGNMIRNESFLCCQVAAIIYYKLLIPLLFILWQIFKTKDTLLIL